MENEIIAVAMSGGVDSSTVAALLREQGHQIVGLTMQLWNQRRLPDGAGDGPRVHRCCSLDDVYDARRVAQHLGFPFYVVNFERQFEDAVVRPFVADYLAGRTPIPCARCNSFLKFDDLIRLARQLGAERLATGHYARIRRDPASGRYELLRALDPAKDQSYFLFGLTQEQLARTVFPLGEMNKTEVREAARAASLPVAEKPESQEICFVPSGKYSEFIEAYMREQGTPLSPASGEIATAEGDVVGRHGGVHRYTVGQRRGLGLAGGPPLYVLEIDAARNRLIVGENAALGRDCCEVRDVNWIAAEGGAEPIEAEVKIRYRHPSARARIEPLAPGLARVHFETPQRAVTPGQAAVFYRGEVVLGGGWII
jgi:tRNA-uridine 2-sulfurtransferase